MVVYTGEHLFKVVGHSLVTAGSKICLTSKTFRVGGHDWAINYYPDGDGSIFDGQFTSVFLSLVSDIESEVTVSYYFSLHDPASPTTCEKSKTSFSIKLSPLMTGNVKQWGDKFLSKDDLAASGCLDNDCLVIKCRVNVNEHVSPAAAVTKTSSTVVVHTSEQLFKVSDHSTLTDSNTRLMSETFRVGGHDWAIIYYPNGDASIDDGQFMSVFLQLLSTTESEVTASYSISLQSPSSPVVETKKFSFARKFTSSMHKDGGAWGISKLLSKNDLAASGCLVNDCLVIKCTIVIRDYVDDDDIIKVPPSDLSKDLRNLLVEGFKADLTISIGSFKTFKVHACMLAARSLVFRAQLCGSMMESKQSSINIDGTDADVFEVLLYYIYNDCLPEFMDEATEDATNMAQHLLVAADRYTVERLKLICESKLSRALDVNTVCFILDLAEQYRSQHLKAHGLKFIEKNGKLLPTIENSEGFAQLKNNHPLLARDILARGRAM